MYTGYKELILSDNDINSIYSAGALGEDNREIFCENEYLIACNENNEPFDFFRYNNGKFNRLVNFDSINSNYLGTLKPRNLQQRLAFNLINEDNTTIKLLTGTWGTGKSLILIAAAIQGLEQGRFDKIVWVRNNVQVKNTDALGALPGDSNQKLLPYVMPMADHVGGPDAIARMIDNGSLEVVPLGFLRGRSIRNSVIISSEAENLTKEHIQLLMGRVDEGSQLWLDADVRQRDRVAFEDSKGIEILTDRLKGNKLFGYVHLLRSERSETARLADLLND